MEAQKEMITTKKESRELIEQLFDYIRAIIEILNNTARQIKFQPDMYIKLKNPNFDFQLWEKEYLEALKKIRADLAKLTSNMYDLDMDLILLINKVDEKYKLEREDDP